MSGPIPEDEPHVRSLLDTLRARVTFTVGLSVAPPEDAPFAVAHPEPGDVWSARLHGRQASVELDFLVHAVGTGPEQALWVGDRVRKALLGGDPPIVAGRYVYPIGMVPGSRQPVERDDTVQPPLYVAVCGYRLKSEPV